MNYNVHHDITAGVLLFQFYGSRSHSSVPADCLGGSQEPAVQIYLRQHAQGIYRKSKAVFTPEHRKKKGRVQTQKTKVPKYPKVSEYKVPNSGVGT